MNDSFEQPFVIGKPELEVIWEYGVVTCTDEAFSVIWNEGSPEMPTQQIAGVKGATNSFSLGIFLYSTMERYIRTEIGYSTRNCLQLLTSIDRQTNTISMAMPFNSGKQHVVGTLKFRIIPQV